VFAVEGADELVGDGFPGVGTPALAARVVEGGQRREQARQAEQARGQVQAGQQRVGAG
jgi:hypothetical protein